MLHRKQQNKNIFSMKTFKKLILSLIEILLYLNKNVYNY